jgi:small subunit ribosomal protein S17
MSDAAVKNTRTLVGRIVSDKRAKTVTVLIERRTAHELYGKIVARSRKYHAHDEKGEYKMGDVVEIAEGRPISKTKSWVVTRLVEKGQAGLTPRWGLPQRPCKPRPDAGYSRAGRSR